MMNKSNTMKDPVEIAISHIRATGPVSFADVANYLLEQSSAVLTEADALAAAHRAIRHGLGTGAIREHGGTFFA